MNLLQVSIPLAVAVVAWWLNETAKRRNEEYVRKEQNYKALLVSLPGFHADNQIAGSKQQFLERLNECWLYCPDEVIRAAYAFIASVRVAANSTAEDRQLACGKLVAAIRRDLHARKPVRETALTANDFQVLKVT